jgi:hypothetical protein
MNALADDANKGAASSKIQKYEEDAEQNKVGVDSIKDSLISVDAGMEAGVVAKVQELLDGDIASKTALTKGLDVFSI